MFSDACIPQKSGAVIAGRCEQSSIGTEIHRVDVGCMPGQCPQLTPRRYVPNLDCVITTARSQQSTVTTKSDLGHAFTVGLEFSDLLARRCIPEHNLSDRLDLHIFHELVGIGWLLVLGSFLTRLTHLRAYHLIQIRL